MENPRQKRNRACALAALGGVVMAIATWLPGGKPDATWRVVVGITGATAAFWGVAGACFWQVGVRRAARLARGEGVLARWTVDTAQWIQFREASRSWDTRPEIGRNRVDLDQAPDSGGMAIVVADNAVRVGADFHSVEKDVDVSVHEGWMQFDQLIRDPNGSDARIILRIPFPRGAEADARRIKQRFNQAYVAAAANPYIKLYILLGIFLGIPAIVGAIMLLRAWLGAD
jgi:hypothetical protein